MASDLDFIFGAQTVNRLSKSFFWRTSLRRDLVYGFYKKEESNGMKTWAGSDYLEMIISSKDFPFHQQQAEQSRVRATEKRI